MIQKPGTEFSLFFISLSKYDYCILSKSKTLLEIMKSSVKRLVIVFFSIYQQVEKKGKDPIYNRKTK